MKSPIQWFGGKGLMTKTLIPLLPDHTLYVEAFGGGGSLLFAKSYSPNEVYNDVDSTLADFFRLLQDAEAFEIFYQKCLLTPYSREIYDEFKHTWKQQHDKIERIYRWFVLARQSFSGRIGEGWSFSLKKVKPAKVFTNAVDRLPAVVTRLREVQIENESWEVILERYDSPTTFFYLDPPYVNSTRLGGGYAYEMLDAEHKDLIERIQRLKGKVMLSGYANPIYEMLPWQRYDIQSVCHAIGKTRNSALQGEGKIREKAKRVESLWLNYEPQQLLLPIS